MSVKIQIRRGTSSEWTSSNPILSEGELGLETDTNKVKVGNGTSTWTQLSYLIDSFATSIADKVSKSGGDTITVTTGSTVPLTIQNNGTGASLVVNDQGSDTTPFVIDASGNVGVGKSSPATAVDVNGTVTATAFVGQNSLELPQFTVSTSGPTNPQNYRAGTLWAVVY